jgi:hypothetical protein
MTHYKLLLGFGLAGALLSADIIYSAAGSDEPNLAVIHQIKAEAFQNSKVMDHEFYLADVYGPRLAGSPGYQAAGDWVVKRLKEYGLTNVHQEPWGPFGRGWTYSHFSASMIEPQYQPLIGFPLAWTPGTNGAVQGEAILAPISSEADFAKFKGKLRGKVVLTMPLKPLSMSMEPMGHRLTDSELLARAATPDPSRLGNFLRPPAGGPAPAPTPTPQFRNQMNKFLKDEGALARAPPFATQGRLPSGRRRRHHAAGQRRGSRKGQR